MSEKTFDLKLSKQLKSSWVQLDDEEIEIRELTGPERDKRLNAMKNMADKKGQVKDFGLLFVSLLSMCVYKDNVLVAAEEIKKWPASTQQAIYDKAEELSLLNVAAKEDAKNS